VLKRVARAQPPPRLTPAELLYLLHAARRIGGARTLDALLTEEERLSAVLAAQQASADKRGAGNSPDRVDEADGVNGAAGPEAVHEALVGVARRNLAALYLILKDRKPSFRRTGGAEAGRGRRARRSRVVARGGRGGSAKHPARGIRPARRSRGDAGARSSARRSRAVAAGAAASALGLRGEEGIGVLVKALERDDPSLGKQVTAVLAKVQGTELQVLARLAAEMGVPATDTGAPLALELVAAIDAKFAAKRARAVEELLGRAEKAADRAGGDEAMALLEETMRVYPTAYVQAIDRVARIAVDIYRARRSDGRGDARAPLEMVLSLGGPVTEPSFHAAIRENRIEQARAMAKGDPEAALAFLGGGPRCRRTPTSDRRRYASCSTCSTGSSSVESTRRRAGRSSGRGVLARRWPTCDHANASSWCGAWRGDDGRVGGGGGGARRPRDGASGSTASAGGSRRNPDGRSVGDGATPALIACTHRR